MNTPLQCTVTISCDLVLKLEVIISATSNHFTSMKIKNFTKNQNGALVLRVSRALLALLLYVARKLGSLVTLCLTCFLPCV